MKTKLSVGDLVNHCSLTWTVERVGGGWVTLSRSCGEIVLETTRVRSADCRLLCMIHTHTPPALCGGDLRHHTRDETMSKKQWCVAAGDNVDAVGRTAAYGDGITSASSRLYGIFDSREDAERHLAALESGPVFMRGMSPGDGRSLPNLEVCEYTPLKYVGRQNRDQYTGKRYAALCGDLAAAAKTNTAELMRTP